MWRIASRSRQLCWSLAGPARDAMLGPKAGPARDADPADPQLTGPRAPPLANPQQPVLIMLSQRQRLTTGTVELAPATSKPPTERYRQVCHELHTGLVPEHAHTLPPTVQAVASGASSVARKRERSRGAEQAPPLPTGAASERGRGRKAEQSLPSPLASGESETDGPSRPSSASPPHCQVGESEAEG